MTDYLKTQNERRATLMAQVFADWERRLRGWRIWDYAVSLEPAFLPIKTPAPQVVAPVQDDAKIQGGFGRLFGRNQANQQRVSINESRLLPQQTGEASNKPTAFYRNESLSELSIILPKEFDASPAVCEQFFLSLSSFSTPVSFEILADASSISIQLACDYSLASHLKNQIKTFFSDCVINENQAVLKSHLTNQEQTVIADFGLARQLLSPLQAFRSYNPDPLTGLISSLANLQAGEKAVVQILFQKAKQNWAEEVNKVFANADFKSVFSNQISLLREKFSAPLFAVLVRLAVESPDKAQSWNILRRIGSSFSQFATPNGNELIALSNDGLSANNHFLSVLNRTSYRSGMLLSAIELASLAHLPSSAVKVEKLKRETANTKAVPNTALNHTLILGINEHQGNIRQVSLSDEQRTRHIHSIGSSGSGKSTLLLNLIKQDLENNQGLCAIDPHGDLIDSVIENVPESRIKDVILLDPSDSEYPIGFNILRAKSELEKTLLSSDLVATFRRMATSWGDVMDSVLANAVLAFVESDKGGTLFELKRFLVEKDFRNEFLKTVRDEGVRYFWQNEFPLIHGKPQSSILIRLDTFLRQKLIRNIVCQKENKLDFRRIMDNRKVLLIKLSQGLIGEENAYLLGTLLVSKLYQTALSRQDSNSRPYFWLYLDEFHHFITPSMESILSGVRKYNIGLHLAHQEFRQLQSRSGEVASSVLSNCYTRICFRLGDTDAEKFASGFSFFDAKALQNLGIGEAIARIERAEYDFNLKTSQIPNVDKETANQRIQAILQNTREQYSKPKPEVERELLSERTALQTLVETKQEKIIQIQPEKASTKSVEPIEQAEIISLEEDAQADNSHRYLQNIIKRIGENNGFVATIERKIFGGIGKVDVALENENLKIACEIAVTNTVEYELNNIQKCLASGFDKLAVISTDSKHLANIRKKAESVISTEQIVKVHFLEPDSFNLFLESLCQARANNENKIKGYKVKVDFKESSENETASRKHTALEVISDLIKRKGKK